MKRRAAPAPHGSLVQVTTYPGSEQQPSFSPDGKQIAFDAGRDPDLGSNETKRIYVVELAGLHVRKLVDSAGPHTNPKWSPDGKQIAYVTSGGDPFFFFGNSFIATVPADGGTLIRFRLPCAGPARGPDSALAGSAP